MVHYDPAVIQQFGAGLYRKSRSIASTRAVLGVLTGGAIGFFGAALLHTGLLPPLIGAAVFGWVGYTTGMERSFCLRLQEQMALCQLQIEANTRMANSGTGRAPAAPHQAAA